MQSSLTGILLASSVVAHQFGIRQLMQGASVEQSCAVVALLAVLVTTSIMVAARVPCPAGCGTYGTCYEPLGRCDCPWNRTGLDCQLLYEGYCVQRLGVDNPIDTCNDGHPSLCVNGCAGRGECMGGFCHCKAGYFGTDCSLSYDASGSQVEVLAGLGYRPTRRGPLVYVYQLPPMYHVKRNIHSIDRPPLHLAILERLLTAGHVTGDGAQADYFYLPVSSRELKRAYLLRPMLQYISDHWPYWNQTGGHRHVVTMDGDVGTCELPLKARQAMENVTFLQFWGMYDYHPLWKHIFHNEIPCFVPGRDIVIPFMAMSSHDRSVIATPLHPKNAHPVRNITFFFAGGICGSGNKRNTNCTSSYKQIRYSGGVRQAIFNRYASQPNWRVVMGTDDYGRDYTHSKFCLAAAGGGFGKRGVVAAMYGCVPLAATDFLYEVFEPEISWNETGFGIRISQAQIPSLSNIIDSVDDARLAEMQRRVRCAAQHFHWSSNLGSIFLESGEFDAFATTMFILQMRRKHPGMAPDRYYREDPEFRNFVDCIPADNSTPASPATLPLRRRRKRRRLGVGGDNPSVQTLCAMYVGPLQIRWDETCPAAKYYMRRKIGPPGGAVCVGAPDLAHCTRFH